MNIINRQDYAPGYRQPRVDVRAAIDAAREHREYVAMGRRVVALYRQGASIRIAAKKLGLTYADARNMVNEFDVRSSEGVEYEPVEKPESAAWKNYKAQQVAIGVLRRGGSKAEAAEASGLSEWSVTSVHNVLMRPKVVEWLQAGRTIMEVRKGLGVSKSFVDVTIAEMKSDGLLPEVRPTGPQPRGPAARQRNRKPTPPRKGLPPRRKLTPEQERIVFLLDHGASVDEVMAATGAPRGKVAQLKRRRVDIQRKEPVDDQRSTAVA